MLRGVPQGSVLGPYLFSLYVHPLLNLLNSFSGVTADMYADDLSIIVKGQSREDAIPTANMVLKKLHVWSQENGLAINPSKCEAAWFTLSTHTESDYDREGKWPLVVAGCEIPVMTMGAIANYEASWHGSRSTTDAKCGGLPSSALPLRNGYRSYAA
ncbi:hypothetical protein TcYC6_0033960 [Trypanosoma cruzi]|nr:hypothetical protein TcYC6_0033960 [Trypanosoma cruzi]